MFGAKYPKVGDKISAKICRATPEQNWTAENVTLVDEVWEVDGREEYCKDKQKNGSSVVNSENSRKKAIISTVKTISNLGVVTTRDGVEFNFKVCMGKFLVVYNRIIYNNHNLNPQNMQYDYIPRPGDVLCLTCLVDKDYEDESQIIDFKPTLTGRVEGEITLCRAEDGVINDQVWFSKSSCGKNYWPRKGDKVVCQTVERNLGNYMWRATTVTPVQAKSSNHHNKSKMLVINY